MELAVEALEGRCLLSSGYVQTNLVSDIPGLARSTDGQLTNPWGIAFDPGGPFWISDNHAGVSTLYASTGQAVPLTVHVPEGGGAFSAMDGAPTSTVFNGGPGFIVSDGAISGPSLFLFTTEDGTISGWNPFVNDTHAILAVDNSSAGADYKGLAIGRGAGGDLLFAANFAAGTIDVFDSSFQRVQTTGLFTDPSLPAGFAPFGIENIGGKLFVSYALPDGQGDEVYGAGQGIIDVYDTSGHLLQQFASGGVLNAPWGMALAPPGFGAFGGALLAGNVGDGRINAFDPNSGAWLGQLQDNSGQPIELPGVWGLTFGGGGASGNPDTLFFTAGVKDEQHGLFGSIQSGDQPSTDSSAGGGQIEYATTTAADDYPLPPTAPPTFRDGVEGKPAELPVLIPLRPSLSAAAQAPTTVTLGNLPTSAGTAGSAIPGSYATEFSAAGDLGSHRVTGVLARAFRNGDGTDERWRPRQTPMPQAGPTRAVDLLLALHTNAEVSESSAVSFEEAYRRYPGDLDGSIVPAGFSAANRGAVNAAEENDARLTEDQAGKSSPARPVDFWFSLPLGLGLYLAWSYRSVGQAEDKEAARPRLVRS